MGTGNPLQGLLARFSFFENTDRGLHRAVQTAAYYSRRRQILTEFPEQAEYLLGFNDGEYLVTDEIPTAIPEEYRERLVQIFQRCRGVLIVLDTSEVQRLDLEETDNFEVAEDGGR